MRNRIIGAVCALCVAASGFVLSQRSRSNLDVDPPLVAVTECAIEKTPVYFIVIDGGRTAEEHKINVANGKSWVKRSRHQDGKAIDVLAVVNGAASYAPEPYYRISKAFYTCSSQLDIPIVWGGEWKAKDLMHIELDRRRYP